MARHFGPSDGRHGSSSDGPRKRPRIEGESGGSTARRSLASVPLEVADVPSLDDLTAVDPPLSPAILGLYRGPSENEACDAGGPQPCRSIAIYWKNLARFARDRQELAEQVRVTLLHELGHLHGENDDELRDRGLE